MTQPQRLDVVLCWHMHQPQYRRVSTGEYQLPWSYLHAIKDYADMAWHLEQHDGAKAVVNFTPVLLDQLEDYERQFKERRFRDPLLRALAAPENVSDDDRPRLIASLFRANAERMIARIPSFVAMKALYDAANGEDGVAYLSHAFLADLVVVYHLAWLGESVRRTDRRAAALLSKGRGFEAADREALLDVIGETIASIVPRYRALAGAGRVELSTSPWAHPIVPLLIDFRSALEAMPDASLPHGDGYPDGRKRAVAHLRAAVESHTRLFGSAPVGCWPSEGSISQATAELLAEEGFSWTASCESVLVTSLKRSSEGLGSRAEYLYRPYAIGSREQNVPCFFRDVHLSDLIGFRYSTWHADDAVANLVSELDAIRHATAEGPARVVSIILDGENAWEHYPENAFHFLNGLYGALSEDERFRLTTFADALHHHRDRPRLDPLVAGSWVFGTFSTWIGGRDKDRAWDLLIAAKRAFDGEAAAGRLRGDAYRRAEAHLKVCEGSDWFWWFGDYNPAQTVSDFDRLFRAHLSDLYAMIGVAAPAEVEAVIGVGKGSPKHGGAMRENAVQ